jgi:ABC-type multidrug transport system fused ATPase/permease subunit
MIFLKNKSLKTDKGMLAQNLQFFLYKGVAPILLVVGVCLIISSYLGLQIPQTVAELSKSYSEEEKYYETMKYLLVIFLATYFNRFIFQLLLNRYVFLISQNIRSTLFSKWLTHFDIRHEKDKENQDDFPQGEVIARIMSDTLSIRELVTSGAMGIVIDLFFVISCLVSFIQLSPQIGPFLAIVEFLACVLLIAGSGKMRAIFHKVRRAKGKLSQVIANVVGGVEDAYYQKNYQYAQKMGEKASADFLYKQNIANIWDASYYSTAESLYPILLAFVVIVFPFTKITEAAIIFATVDLIQRSIDPIKAVAGKISNIQRAITGISRINEFRDTLSSQSVEYQPLSDTNDLDFHFKELIVDIKDFHYFKKATGSEARQSFSLRDIKFNMNGGKLLGIAGSSGCGKSTLLNLLAGNLRPNQGSITIVDQLGNENIFPGKQWSDFQRYRELVSFISQESHIFTGSLMFNLTFSYTTPHHFEEFWEWAKELVPFLKKWRFNPQDEISRKSISMGEAQLISALRSCYQKTPVAIFDEIASGLDSELEDALRMTILLLQKNSLTIFVAHRLETILEADQIIVMDQGKIVDMGEHGELITHSHIYQNFVSELSSL